MGIRHQVLDSLFNVITGLGTAKDPTTSSQYALNLLNRNDCENAYRGDWIARKVVDAPAEDATREWRQWHANGPQIEAIEKVERTFELQKKVRQALIRSRLYGGAAIVMGVDQGETEDELDLETVGAGDLRFLVVLNRYELMAGPRIYNVESPWYTRPEYYTVATPMFGFYGEEGLSYPSVNPSQPGSAGKPGFFSRKTQQQEEGDTLRQMTPARGMVRVHPSRVIEFSGNELPDWRLIPLGGSWGDSVLQTLDETLKDIGLIVGGIANMVNDGKMDVVKIPNFSQNIGTTEYANRLLSRFAYANQAKSTINSLVLDSTEEWDRVQTNFGGLPNLLNEFLSVVAGAADIPMSRLMGKSPGRGLGQGGGSGTGGGADADERNYFDRIAAKQKTVYSPAMASLDQVVVRSALGFYDEKIHYEWNPLWQLSDAEKAKISLDKANITKIDVETGLLNEDALRRARVNQITEDGTYPGFEDAIDEFGEEPDEESIQVMWSRLAGKLPPPPAPGEGPGAGAPKIGGAKPPPEENNNKDNKPDGE